MLDAVLVIVIFASPFIAFAAWFVIGEWRDERAFNRRITAEREAHEARRRALDQGAGHGG